MKKPPEERRRYFRVTVPIDVKTITGDHKIAVTQTKNLSPLGVRFETMLPIKKGERIELILGIPDAPNPVHAQGKVVWQKKVSLENGVPYDIGCEFTRIEEDNKNTFLKYFCDVLYGEIEGLTVNKKAGDER